MKNYVVAMYIAAIYIGPCPAKSHAKIKKNLKIYNQYDLINTQKIELKELIQELSNINNINEINILFLIKKITNNIFPQENRVKALQERITQFQKKVLEKLATKKNADTSNPVVSFIMPCYNRITTITTSINSIYTQNIPFPFEVIIVDDASTDGSYELLQEFENIYPNLFVYRNPTNQRAPITRNNAIAYARGDIICNADSDDIFEPNSLAPIIENMVNAKYPVVFFESFIFFNDSPQNPTHTVSSTPPQYRLSIHELLSGKYLSAASGNRLFTKESWLNAGGYIEDRGHDSWSFSFKLFANGYFGYIYPKSFYYAKVWQDQSSMWWNDQKNNVNDISPTIVLFEHPELFTPESFQIIYQYALAKKPKIMDFINAKFNKKISTIPNKQLTALLQAYQSDIKNNFTQSLEYYLITLTYPHIHPTVYIRAARAAIFEKKYDTALILLQKLKINY